MTQHDVVTLRPGGERAQTAQHLGAVRGGIVAFRDEEREQPDVPRLELLGNPQRSVEADQMSVEVVVDADLSDR